MHDEFALAAAKVEGMESVIDTLDLDELPMETLLQLENMLSRAVGDREILRMVLASGD